MDFFVQQLFNGLVLGSIYALIALGYTMVYGIMGLINFAHGEVVMMGAMITLSLVNLLSGTHWPGPVILLLALLLALPLTSLLGWVIERVAYRPLRHAPRLAPLISAIGMSIVLQNVAMLFWGRNYRSFPELIPNTPFHLLGATLTSTKVLIIGVAVVLMLALLALIERTRMGRAMRATAEKPEVAQLMGVNVNRMISLTFVLGSALAAVAGIMVGLKDGQAHPTMGFIIGLKAFSAAVLGGIGNIPGALVGGLLLGLIESLGAGYLGRVSDALLSPSLQGLFGSQYQDVFAFLVLIAVLIFRPSGLLGERVAERA